MSLKQHCSWFDMSVPSGRHQILLVSHAYIHEHLNNKIMCSIKLTIVCCCSHCCCCCFFFSIYFYIWHDKHCREIRPGNGFFPEYCRVIIENRFYRFVNWINSTFPNSIAILGNLKFETSISSTWRCKHFSKTLNKCQIIHWTIDFQPISA